VGKARRDAPLTSCLSDFRGSNAMASKVVSVFDSYFNRMYQAKVILYFKIFGKALLTHSVEDCS
jgi:hypothetical protein